MVQRITENLRNALESPTVNPQLVLEIEGVDTIFGASAVQKYIHFDEPGLFFDTGWFFDGLNEVENQAPIISFAGGTSRVFRQSLSLDQGGSQSVPSVSVALIDDDDDAMAKLISPGQVVEDLLGRRAKLWFTFKDVAFPQDALPIFRGVIGDILADSKCITVVVDHPDTLRRQKCFKKATTTVLGEIDQYVTSIPVGNTTHFLVPITGPDGTIDPTFRCYAMIDDELVRYTGKTDTHLTGCSRAQLGTVAAPHEHDAEVSSFYWFEGDAMTVALKLQLSGYSGPYTQEITAKKIESNEVLFNFDLNAKHGVVAGDYVTLAGSDQNDFENKRIEEVVLNDDGTSYIFIDGVDLADDPDGTGTFSFRSQYDTWPDGLKIHPEYIDIEEFHRIQRLFLSGFEYEFYVPDTITGKDFLEKEVFKPCACYSVPRKARSSVAYTTDPIPGQTIQKLSASNVSTPSKIRLRRTTHKYFFNQIAYKFDETLSGKFSTHVYVLSADSLNRIPVGIKTLEIAARGMRTYQQAESLANSAGQRKLARFRFGAEHFDQVIVNLRDAFEIEIGDVVLFDTTDLKIVDTKTGTRAGFRRMYEVINKEQPLDSPKVTLALLDINADASIRYGLISPSSRIKAGLNNKTIMIEQAFRSEFGTNEYKKWRQLTRPAVRIHNDDFSLSAISTIKSLDLNVVHLVDALPFVPSAGMWLDFPPYDSCTDEQRILYAFMTDEGEFPDGKVQNSML